MKRNLYYFLFILILFFLQSALVKVFPGSFWIPHLLLLFAIAAAITEESGRATTLAFIAGFFGELFSTMAFGSIISSMLAATLAAHFFTRKLTSQEIPARTGTLIVLAETLIVIAWIYLYNLAANGLGFGESIRLSEIFRFAILWQFIVNVIFFFPINRLYRIIFND